MNNNIQIRFGPKLTPVVKRIIEINIAVFILQMIIKFSPINYHAFLRVFGLTPKMINDHFMLWQFITYMFLHGGFLHLFVNMFGLWMFGCEIESAWGGKRFLQYYFITGLSAGAATYFLALRSLFPTIGASGALFGILIAFGILFPNRKVLLFFILPVKALFLVLFYGFLEFYSTLHYSQGGIAHIAHLGGMAAGAIYLLIIKQPVLSGIFLNIINKCKSIFQRNKFKKISSMQERAKYLINKLSRGGINSLSSDEREFLLRFSKNEPVGNDSTIH